MTRHVCLSAPPDGARVDGVWPIAWHGLPERDELVQVYGRRGWRLGRVCGLDRERGRYSVEVIKG